MVVRRGGGGALAAIAAARRLLAEHLAARGAPLSCAAASASAVPAATQPLVAERLGRGVLASTSTSTIILNPRQQHGSGWHQRALFGSSASDKHHHTCGPACNHDDHDHDPKKSPSLPPSSLDEQEATCWSCNHATRRGGVVCQGCDRIQPLDSQALTYYELFGYNGAGEEERKDRESSSKNSSSKWPPYRLDARDLERRYRELQWALHPDRLTGPGRDAREVQHGAAAAALVNQAYGVLRSPLARANYLLMLRRLPREGGGGGTAAAGAAGDPAARRAAEQQAAARLVEEEERRTAVDPALLMEVMEAREAVEDADDPAQLRAMLASNREAQAALVAKIGDALDGGGGEERRSEEEDEDAAVARAQELAARLSYLVRIQQAIEAKL